MKNLARPSGVRKLEVEGGYRVGVNYYRIVFESDDDARRVTIVRVRHRRDVYRNL